MIDIILLALIFYFVISGLQKGFLSYFLEFLLIVVCIFGARFFYKETNNFLNSLIFLFLSPIILAVVFKFLFHVSTARTQNIKRPVLAHLNNVGGGIIGFVWGIVWAIIFSVVISIIPINNQGFAGLRENVSQSFVFKYVKAMFPIKEVFLIDKVNNLSAVMNSSVATNNLMQNPQFQQLMEDDKIKDFIRDRTVMSQLKNRQILSLLDNPKFIAIFKDLELLRRFMDIDFGSMLEFKSPEEVGDDEEV